MSKVAVNVVVHDTGAVDEVAAALEAAGMRVERVLRGLGIVSGTVERDAMTQLGNVAGVDRVEHDRELHPQ